MWVLSAVKGTIMHPLRVEDAAGGGVKTVGGVRSPHTSHCFYSPPRFSFFPAPVLDDPYDIPRISTNPYKHGLAIDSIGSRVKIRQSGGPFV